MEEEGRRKGQGPELRIMNTNIPAAGHWLLEFQAALSRGAPAPSDVLTLIPEPLLLLGQPQAHVRHGET